MVRILVRIAKWRRIVRRIGMYRTCRPDYRPFFCGLWPGLDLADPYLKNSKNRFLSRIVVR